MTKTFEFKKGDKVHYNPGYGSSENGIIKSVRGEIAFVVFKCGGEWDRYEDYTGQATDISDIMPGWSSIVLGNIYENPELLTQPKERGTRETN